MDNKMLDNEMLGRVLSRVMARNVHNIETQYSWDSLEDILIEMINERPNFSISKTTDQDCSQRDKINTLLEIAKIVGV